MTSGPYFSVELQGDLGLRDVDGLAQRLTDALAGNSAVLVDAAAVTGADLAFVQLLVSARKTATLSGKDFVVSAPADGVLADVFKRAGFVTPQGKPQTPEGDFWTGHIQESGKAA